MIGDAVEGDLAGEGARGGAVAAETSAVAMGGLLDAVGRAVEADEGVGEGAALGGAVDGAEGDEVAAPEDDAGGAGGEDDVVGVGRAVARLDAEGGRFGEGDGEEAGEGEGGASGRGVGDRLDRTVGGEGHGVRRRERRGGRWW